MRNYFHSWVFLVFLLANIFQCIEICFNQIVNWKWLFRTIICIDLKKTSFSLGLYKNGSQNFVHFSPFSLSIPFRIFYVLFRSDPTNCISLIPLITLTIWMHRENIAEKKFIESVNKNWFPLLFVVRVKKKNSENFELRTISQMNWRKTNNKIAHETRNPFRENRSDSRETKRERTRTVTERR